VNQLDSEWKDALDDLEKVASRVCDVGASCEQYGLEEKKLPTGLSKSFQSLQEYVMDSNDRFHWLIVLQ
jgi:hypothetical protein